MPCSLTAVFKSESDLLNVLTVANNQCPVLCCLHSADKCSHDNKGYPKLVGQAVKFMCKRALCVETLLR
jgi:hypothetical protein